MTSYNPHTKGGLQLLYTCEILPKETPAKIFENLKNIQR